MSRLKLVLALSPALHDQDEIDAFLERLHNDKWLKKPHTLGVAARKAF